MQHIPYSMAFSWGPRLAYIASSLSLRGTVIKSACFTLHLHRSIRFPSPLIFAVPFKHEERETVIMSIFMTSVP